MPATQREPFSTPPRAPVAQGPGSATWSGGRRCPAEWGGGEGRGGKRWSARPHPCTRLHPHTRCTNVLPPLLLLAVALEAVLRPRLLARDPVANVKGQHADARNAAKRRRGGGASRQQRQPDKWTTFHERKRVARVPQLWARAQRLWACVQRPWARTRRPRARAQRPRARARRPQARAQRPRARAQARTAHMMRPRVLRAGMRRTSAS